MFFSWRIRVVLLYWRWIGCMEWKKVKNFDLGCIIRLVFGFGM